MRINDYLEKQKGAVFYAEEFNKKEFEALVKPNQIKIHACLDNFVTTGVLRPPKSKKLKGYGCLYELIIDELRIFYCFIELEKKKPCILMLGFEFKQAMKFPKSTYERYQKKAERYCE